MNGEALFVMGSLSHPTRRYVAVDKFERLVERFEERAMSMPTSRLDVLIDPESLGGSRVVRFMLQVLADPSESREVRIYALKWLTDRHFAPDDRRCVADAIRLIAADGSSPDTRVHAVLALAEFTDVDGVQATLGDLALDGNELIDIRYSAFMSLQKAGPTAIAPHTKPAGGICRMAIQITTRANAKVESARETDVPILAATAHELRLPLSHIKGFVSSLRRTDVTWDRDTQNDFLEEIEIEVDRLGQLIDSLLVACPANGAVAPTLRPTLKNPARVIQCALHRVRGLVAERQLRIDVPSRLPSVWMDGSGMERVLANLLQNAVKYSPPGTPIGISARVNDGGELELAVEDDGPGVPAEDRERIFEPFFRRETSVAGHGLGLAISQSIILAHGGRLEVTERLGGGARFTALLPMRMPIQRSQRKVGALRKHP
jgi:signal transduction histidine kinase